MEKEYKQIEFTAGSTIVSCVNKLLSYKEKGELVCGAFNGHMLYSDTVTIDSAFVQITKKTEEEFNKEQKRISEEYKKEQEEHKEKTPDLIKFWREKGREILTEDKWEFWDKIVPIRLNDLYQGMELGQSLDIIKVLNEGGTFETAKNIINSQGHSGMSFGLMCSMLKEFCERGEEFVKFVR